MQTLALVVRITDKGLEIILKHCSSLHYLDIYGVHYITGSSFKCIPQYAHRSHFIVIEEFCGIEKEGEFECIVTIEF